MEKKCIIYRKQTSVPSLIYIDDYDEKTYIILGFINHNSVTWAILEDIDNTLLEVPISWIKIVN